MKGASGPDSCDPASKFWEGLFVWMNANCGSAASPGAAARPGAAAAAAFHRRCRLREALQLLPVLGEPLKSFLQQEQLGRAARGGVGGIPRPAADQHLRRRCPGLGSGFGAAGWKEDAPKEQLRGGALGTAPNLVEEDKPFLRARTSEDGIPKLLVVLSVRSRACGGCPLLCLRV